MIGGGGGGGGGSLRSPDNILFQYSFAPILNVCMIYLLASFMTGAERLAMVSKVLLLIQK